MASTPGCGSLNLAGRTARRLTQDALPGSHAGCASHSLCRGAHVWLTVNETLMSCAHRAGLRECGQDLILWVLVLLLQVCLGLRQHINVS